MPQNERAAGNDADGPGACYETAFEQPAQAIPLTALRDWLSVCHI